MRFFLLSFFFFFSTEILAQQPVFQWAKAFNDRNTSNYRTSSNGRTVGVDLQGNVYSAGLFQHTVDFDPGSGIYTMTGGGTGEYGIYISKLDANGNFIWAKQIPVLVEFGNIELKVDRNGNVYLASNIPDPADMDPGPGVYMMTPIGSKDAFVIKLDTNGNLVWVKQFGGPGDTVPEANGLDIDKDDNVIICGGFNNTVDFDPGPNKFNLTSTAHIQSYIVKLNGNGDFLWAKQFGNSPIVYSGAKITDVKCDPQGNIYTIGGFAGTCDFDPGPAVYNLSGQGIRDGFIAKLDANSNFIWAKSVNNATTYYNYLADLHGLDIDNMNNIIIAGAFIGTFDFDPGSGVYTVASTAGNYDCFILKLNEQGDFMWVKTIGNNESDTGNDVVVDSDNNIYTIGSFGTSVDFDPGPGNFTINSSYYGASALVKLNTNGNFIYATAYQSISYGTSLFRRMIVDPSGNIYITGSVSGSVDFDHGSNVYPLSSSTDASPFVLKLGRCTNITTSILDINVCNSYTLNNESFDTSGTYIRTIPNASGCDSIITLNLIINKKITQQTKAICEGDFFFIGGATQNTAGTYKDTLQTSQGCDSIVTTYLTVNPKPSPNLGPDKDLCSDTQLTVTPGSFTSYLWQDMSNANSYTIKAAGVYWVKVTNSFNCSATDTFNVRTMLSLPTNFLKSKDSICAYQNLEIVSANVYTKYQWSTGAVDSKIMVQKPGMYWLLVTDANGCSGADTINVFSKQCMSGFFIPNAFSPNNDSKNDLFRPMLFGKVMLYEFTIYNQWGEVVFKSIDLNKGWDGKYKSLPQDNKIFVWTCKYQFENESVKTEKGTVLILR